MSKIRFTNVHGLNDHFPPEPASKNIPEWYKELESYPKGKHPKGNGTPEMITIKRCMPVFDALNSGYIIKSPTDVWVSQRPNITTDPVTNEQQVSDKKYPYFEWPSFNTIQFHPVEQAPNHPNKNGHEIAYPKWINPWAIKTPSGYSTLFVQPFHRESVFTILPGVVDTDNYTAPVNFPFVLNDITWEGLIPAGTPIAQVIPFKRETWEMEFGNFEDIENQTKLTLLLKTKIFDSYKTQFRTLKEYR